MEDEIKKLEEAKKQLKIFKDMDKKDKEKNEKLTKRRDKLQADIDKIKESLAKKEREQFAKEKRLYKSKSFEKIKEREIKLLQQNEGDRVIIQDKNAFPSDREAAEARVAEKNGELGRLQTQVEEREAAMPLRERVREIFKKHGVTVTAIFLAAGITIGAVVGTITNALKTLGKQMGNGLKAVGAQAASALHGLIGSIVSFLFKTSGQAIGFLTEHTWLLILAVVVFIVEKYLKRQRNDKNSKAPSPTTPIITAVLFISCCGVFF